MEIKTDSLNFDSFKGSGPRIGSKDIFFERNVRTATAILTGADFGFSPRRDRPFGKVDITVKANILDNTVRVITSFGVRDWSGNWDDAYEGTVYFAVLAELT